MVIKTRKPRRNVDTCPHIKAAGCDQINNPITLKICIEPDTHGEKKETPEIVRKKQVGRNRRDPGEYNPEIFDLVHGVKINQSLTAKEVVHKVPLDDAATLLEKRAESVYKSNKNRPLGRSYAHNITFPDHMQEEDFRFGIGSTRGESASTLVHGNPTSTGEAERRRYILSHGNYDPGEQRDRNYDWSTFSRDKMFGVATKHESNGAKVRESLQWQTEAARARHTILVSKCVDDFRSKTQCELGKVHDPLTDTMNVPHDYTFGITLVPDEYNAADLIRRQYHPKGEEGLDEDDMTKTGNAGSPSAEVADKAFGVPTVRRDINPPNIHRYDPNPDLKLPKIRSIADTQNYGDGSTAAGLLNSPYRSSGHAAYYERPRSKCELRRIYEDAGLSDTEFERTWTAVSKQAGETEGETKNSIASFRKYLRVV